MTDTSKDKEGKDKESKDKQSNSKKAPSILILFKVNDAAPWAVYPRLFNTEETALTKLEQSYPFTEHCFQTCDFK